MRLLRFASSVCLLLAAATGLTANAQADTVVVNTAGLAFIPADITIEVGDTVRWNETSGIGHTVTEGSDPNDLANALFNSPLDSFTTSFEFTFTAAFVAANPRPGGVYDYYCLPHFFANMVGTITVIDSPYESFCSGDGGDQMGCTDCPCSNNAPVGSPGGCLNSNSQSAELIASGDPSVSNDTMRYEMTGGNPNSFAILSSGASRAPANAVNPCFGLGSGLQSPTLDGLRCAVQQVQRHGTRPMDANGDVGVLTNGWGAPNGPPGGLIAQGGFVLGQTRHYQVVYREEVTLGCMRGLNTSQGISVTFGM